MLVQPQVMPRRHSVRIGKLMSIPTKPVTSSQISEIGYDEPTKTLAVKFKSGGKCGFLLLQEYQA